MSEQGTRKPRIRFDGCWHHDTRPKDATLAELRRWDFAYTWCKRMLKHTYHQQLISDDLWRWLKRGGK